MFEQPENDCLSDHRFARRLPVITEHGVVMRCSACLAEQQGEVLYNVIEDSDAVSATIKRWLWSFKSADEEE